MKHKKLILTAVILSGSVGLGALSISAQDLPGSKRPEQTIPERVQPPGQKSQQPGIAGMSSEDIKKAKEALKAKGLNPGPIDGKMDSKTQQALREFQKANNLPVTGVLDQKTAEKLGITLSGQKGPTQKRGEKGSIPQPGSKGAVK